MWWQLAAGVMGMVNIGETFQHISAKISKIVTVARYFGLRGTVPLMNHYGGFLRA